MSAPEPYPVPEGYSVEGGVLLKDGKPTCNEDYEFKTLVSRSTRDRSYVVTVG